MIDWTQDVGATDEIADPKDLSNNWYLPERRTSMDSPALKHGIDYIVAGLAKFGVTVEWRLRQPTWLAGLCPVVVSFAANFDQVGFGQATKFFWQDACQIAYAGDPAILDATSASGAYNALAGILTEWKIPVTVEQLPPFHALGLVTASNDDPVGVKIDDVSNIHFEVAAGFDASKWLDWSLYTRINPDGSKSMFRRTTFIKHVGFFKTESRPGWRQER